MTEHAVEIADTRHVEVRGDDNRFRLGHGYKELPFDLPVVMEVVRHVKDGADGVKKLVGWEVDMAVLARGHVEVKILHPAGMAILVDGVVVYRDVPGKPPAEQSTDA